MKIESAVKYAGIPAGNQPPKFWRTFKPIVVARGLDKEPVWFCPHAAITADPEKEKLIINYEKCDGCLICVRECHSGIIKEERDIKR